MRSIVTLRTAEPVFPARSWATARTARFPSASSGHEIVYGAVVSVPSETHEPAVQPVLSVEQRKKSTRAMSVSSVATATVNGSSAAAFT